MPAGARRTALPARALSAADGVSAIIGGAAGVREARVAGGSVEKGPGSGVWRPICGRGRDSPAGCELAARGAAPAPFATWVKAAAAGR